VAGLGLELEKLVENGSEWLDIVNFFMVLGSLV
jgi:hypothetical protein